MNLGNFLRELNEILMADGENLELDAELEEFAGWDSMGQLALVALLDEKLGINVEPGVIGKLKTVGDVIKLSGLSD